MAEAASVRSIAVIANSAFSMLNFRGPLIEDMIAAGVKVYGLAPDHDENSRDALRALGAVPVDISLDRAGLGPGRDLRDLIALTHTLRRLNVDTTFAYFIKPVIYGSLAARLAGVPRRFALVAGLGYVYAGRDGPRMLKAAALRVGVSFLYKIAFATCERVFFQNQEDIEHFVERGVLDPSKAIRLNGTGVDLERLRPASPVESPPTFLLMARLLREKGIREYAEAARIIRRDHPQTRFLLLGGLDPNPSGLAEREVRSWVEEGLIEWGGHVDDVRATLAASSVFVLPSYYREGVPRSTQEALAMGKPVITTDNVGCRETVVDSRNGFLVPVRDSIALAEAMRRFIEHPELLQRMGQESRLLAEERFDVRYINALILRKMGIDGPFPATSVADTAISDG